VYPLKLSASPEAPALVLAQLSTARNLVNQALDVVDISTWTGDAHDANFISGQLRLLADLVSEAKAALKGDDAPRKWWEQESFDDKVSRLAFSLVSLQPKRLGA
jgi:hypothetical protein